MTEKCPSSQRLARSPTMKIEYEIGDVVVHLGRHYKIIRKSRWDLHVILMTHVGPTTEEIRLAKVSCRPSRQSIDEAKYS